MAGKATYLETQFLNLIFRAQTAWKPAAIYIGLLTSAPTSDSGGGTEVSAASYARVQVVQSDANWSAPTGTPRSISNLVTITFPTPLQDWGRITNIGIFDSASGGNPLYWPALAAAKNINVGDPAPYFAPASITITED